MQFDPNAAEFFSSLLFLVFFLGFYALLIGAVIKVCTRAGFSGFGVLLFIPVVNIVTLFRFAYGDWPIDEELRRLRTFKSNCTCQPQRLYD